MSKWLTLLLVFSHGGVAEIDDQELLKYFIQNGNIDLEHIQNEIEMNKRESILQEHPYKIWYGKDDNWHTYIVGENGKLKHKKRKERDKLHDDIIEHYKSLIEEPKFRQVYKEWIAEKEECGELEKNSITRYDNAFEKFFPVSEPFCQIKMKNMTDGVVAKFIKRTIHKHELTKKTYGMLTLLLNGVFKQAKRDGYTDFDISSFFGNLILPKKIFTVKVVDDHEQVFTRKESRLLIEYFRQNPTLIHLGLILGFMTGVRVGELCALKAEDNIEKYFLRICRTEVTYKDKEKGKYVTEVKDSPKADSFRIIDIPTKAQTVFDQIKLMSDNDSEYIFSDKYGRIREKRFNYYLKKACVAVGIPPRSTHKMRKTYGSNLLEKEVGEALVQRQLGHKQISTTHNFYHYDITDDVDRARIINENVVY